MATLVGSTIKPDELEEDIVENGRVRLLVHWDIEQVEIVNDEEGGDDEPRMEWQYMEQVIWVPLPHPAYIEPGEHRPVLSEVGRAYLEDNIAEILDWAQAGITEATEAPGGRRRQTELEDAIVELSMLLPGGI